MGPHTLEAGIFSHLMVTGRGDPPSPKVEVPTSHHGEPCGLPSVCRRWGGTGEEALPAFDTPGPRSPAVPPHQHREGILKMERDLGLFYFVRTLNIKKTNRKRKMPKISTKL